MAGNSYYDGNPFGNDDSFLWGATPFVAPDTYGTPQALQNFDYNFGTTNPNLVGAGIGPDDYYNPNPFVASGSYFNQFGGSTDDDYQYLSGANPFAGPQPNLTIPQGPPLGDTFGGYDPVPGSTLTPTGQPGLFNINNPPPATTEQPSLSNNVQNITTTDPSGNSATMNPGGTVTTALTPEQIAANQSATSGPNPLAGLGQTPIPIPGISWPVALGATALLNNGNIFGGGGSITNLPAAVGNVVSHPVDSVNSTVKNIDAQIMGPPSPPTQAGTGAVLPISWPTSNVGQPAAPVAPSVSTPTTPTQAGMPPVVPIDTPAQPTNSPSPLTPAASYPNQTTGPTQGPPPVVPAASAPLNPTPNQPVSGPPVPNQTVTPPVVPVPNQGAANPLTPAPSYPNATTGPNQGAANPVIPATPSTPTHPTENPVTPVTPTPTPGTGVTVPPIVPVTPTMPTDTTIASPLDRNYARETGQTNTDLQSLLFGPSGWLTNYANASGTAGQTDFTNFQNILNQYSNPNSTLTNLANQQTAASNTALRQNNLNDVGNLSQQALQIRQQANPNLFGSLNTGQDAANQYLQQAQAQSQQANFLSPQEMNTAAQAARNAWGARGLVNSPGAVGDEILNTDALLRSRQQQAFTNLGSALGTYGNNTALQSENQFDPFSTILGAQYGQQTGNAGTNNSLYGQTVSISSGGLGNQYAQGVVNPNNVYAQDVYGSNYNSANARNIAAGNNAAAIQGANTQSNSALVNGFLNFAGTYLSRNPSSGGTAGVCYVAREIYGVSNPKWLIFRHWLYTKAPLWFKKLYIKHGEAFAKWISDKPKLKFVIRKWMDARVKSVGFNGSNLHESALSYIFEGEKT